MPIHNWKLVDAGIFHHFHQNWVPEISRALNAGRLPSSYATELKCTRGQHDIPRVTRRIEMTKKEAVMQEIEELPEDLMADVLEYVKRLRLQAAIHRSGTALASEAALAKDWLLDEEDEAWRDL